MAFLLGGQSLLANLGCRRLSPTFRHPRRAVVSVTPSRRHLLLVAENKPLINPLRVAPFGAKAFLPKRFAIRYSISVYKRRTEILQPASGLRVERLKYWVGATDMAIVMNSKKNTSRSDERLR